MIVDIGPYRSWIGPYQLADLAFWLNEDQKNRFGEFLSKTFIGDLCQYIHDRKKRKVKIIVEDFDSWDAYSTLAQVILPVLKSYRRDHDSAPWTNNEDVPERLHGAEDSSKADYKLDDKFFDRWDWILDEMIWAFDNIVTDEDWELPFEEMRARSKRTDNGLRLFGKYFRNLWV